MKANLLKRLKAILGPFVSLMEDVGGFVIAIIDFVFHKIDQVIWITRSVTLKNLQLAEKGRFWLISKLIWSHGRRGSIVKYTVTLGFLWFIFLIGGVFQSMFTNPTPKSRFAFVSSSSILFQGATTATYAGTSTLLEEPVEHRVESGETLVSIGKKYGITIDSIKFANNLVSNKVKVGEILYIPPVEGTLHKVRKGDTIDTLSRRYNVAKQSIVDFNYIDKPYVLTVGSVITIPNAKAPGTERFYAGAKAYGLTAYGVIPYAESGAKGSGNFVWPFSGVITQGFHVYHPAIDIANSSGDIHAADKGVIVRAGWWQGGYGNAVQIDHRNGYVTTYAHMSSIGVSVGEEVKKAQKIGIVGSTGRSTGPHVHFTIQKDGKYLNPLSFF